MTGTKQFPKSFVKYVIPNLSVIAPFIERGEQVQYYKDRALNQGKMVKRCEGCNKSTCKKAEECAMRDACYNVGMGRVRLGR